MTTWFDGFRPSTPTGSPNLCEGTHTKPVRVISFQGERDINHHRTIVPDFVRTNLTERDQTTITWKHQNIYKPTYSMIQKQVILIMKEEWSTSSCWVVIEILWVLPFLYCNSNLSIGAFPLAPSSHCKIK